MGPSRLVEKSATAARRHRPERASRSPMPNPKHGLGQSIGIQARIPVPVLRVEWHSLARRTSRKMRFLGGPEVV